jgi:hypothetical protein
MIRLRAIIGRKLVRPKTPVVLLRTPLRDLLDLSGRQREPRRAQVVAEPLLLARRRHDRDPLLDRPAQANLPRAHRVLARERRERRVQRARRPARDGRQRAVGRRGDAARAQVGEQPRAREVPVQLDLVHRRHQRVAVAAVEHGGQVLGQEVADADRGREPGRAQARHGGPGGAQRGGRVGPARALVGEVGRVQQVEVDAVELQLLERGAQRGLDVVGAVHHLGRDVEAGARDATLLDGDAHLGLVAVAWVLVSARLPTGRGSALLSAQSRWR